MTQFLENKAKINPSHIFDRSGVNKVFVSPTFMPNLSLEKSINGLGSPSVLPVNRSHLLDQISNGKISMKGPIFLYLPGKFMLNNPAFYNAQKLSKVFKKLI